MAPWKSTDYVVGHVAAVLGDRMIDNARVVVREGHVVEVGAHPPGASCDLDGRGAHLLPGLVDVHSDMLTKELCPRPGATLDPSFALGSAGARLRAAGITTAFHGLAFQQRSILGMPIGSPDAVDLSHVLRNPPDTQADHRILHRLDVRCAYGRTTLDDHLARLPPEGGLPVVSYEDHTPGIGQFHDEATMRRWLVLGEGMTEQQAADHVAGLRRDRNLRLDIRDSALAWLGHLTHAGRIRLWGHDLATSAEVNALVAHGGTVAEFPTTLTAARAARERNMLIVAGAPNVIRGRSHTRNVSATELARAGLVDALASDYLPTAMLPAALKLARDGVMTLPRAIALVTAGPAACVGLHDRGSLREGARADLVLADLSSTWPVVHPLCPPAASARVADATES